MFFMMRCGFVADTSMRLRIAALVCRFNCTVVVNVGFTTGCFIGRLSKRIRNIFCRVSVMADPVQNGADSRGYSSVLSVRNKSPLPISAVARSILRLHPARAHHAPAAKSLEEHEHAGTNQRDASPDIPKANRDATKKTETTQRPANDAAGAINVWVEEFRHGQEVAYPQANATWDKKPQAGLLPPAALCSYSSSLSLSVPTSTAGCLPWWKIA